MSTEQTQKQVLVNGQPIVDVISQSTNAIVALSLSGGLVFEYSAALPNSEKITNKFHSLDSKLSRNLPDSLFKTLQRELGAALYSALLSENVDAAMSCFVSIEERIAKVKEPEQAKAILVVSSLATSAIILTVLLTLKHANIFQAGEIYLCMSAGLCGSLFSLLNRNKAVHLNLLGGCQFIVIQSLTISITGCISGVIVYVASKSNIAFGFASSDLYTLLTLCIVSGFSERLIPDLFGKIDESTRI